MARKKVTLAWIPNDTTRRATFKKRKKGLLKKVSELSTLCDVKACVIVYGPQDLRPEVWPSVPEAMSIIDRFKSMPELDQCKKMMNQEGFLRQRMAKLQEQLRKQEHENRELHITNLLHECLNGKSLRDVGIEDTTSLAWMVEMKLKMIQNKIENLKKQQQQVDSLDVKAMPSNAGAFENEQKNKIAMDSVLQMRLNWMIESNDEHYHNVMFNHGGGGEHQENMQVNYVNHDVSNNVSNSAPWMESFYLSR